MSDLSCKLMNLTLDSSSCQFHYVLLTNNLVASEWHCWIAVQSIPPDENSFHFRARFRLFNRDVQQLRDFNSGIKLARPLWFFFVIIVLGKLQTWQNCRHDQYVLDISSGSHFLLKGRCFWEHEGTSFFEIYRQFSFRSKKLHSEIFLELFPVSSLLATEANPSPPPPKKEKIQDLPQGKMYSFPNYDGIDWEQSVYQPF